MTKEDVWYEYMSSKWIAANGLGRLDPYPDMNLDGGALDGNGLECVRNENGILFLTLFLLTSKLAGLKISLYSITLQGTIETLVRKPYRGLFNRRPYGDMPVDRHEAHDNYAAISGISSVFALSYPKEILSYGATTGYIYNNVEPKNLDLKYLRQGGEIAFYKLCAGYSPAIWEWVWFISGLAMNAFKDGAGETQLAWLRLYCASRVEMHNQIYNVSFYLVGILWKWRKNKRFGSLENVFREYFREDHPIRNMAFFISRNQWGF